MHDNGDWHARPNAAILADHLGESRVGQPGMNQDAGIQRNDSRAGSRLPGLERDRIRNDGAEHIVIQQGFVAVAETEGARGWHDRR